MENTQITLPEAFLKRWLVAVNKELTIEQIEKDFDRDNWMTAIEAKEYGLVDEVLVTNPRKQKKD